MTLTGNPSSYRMSYSRREEKQLSSKKKKKKLQKGKGLAKGNRNRLWKGITKSKRAG